MNTKNAFPTPILILILIPILILILILLLLISPLLLPLSAAASPLAPAAYTLSGRVYEGDTGLEPPQTTPLQGVTVSLYCSGNHAQQGTFLRSTTTDQYGWYGLTVNEREAANCEFLNIVETDPDGYTSDGATTVDGDVITANWIEYITPLDGKTLTGNKFWDKPLATDTPTPEPTATDTPTPEPTATWTPTPEPTATDTPTPEPTATWTPTPEPTATDTPTPEPTATWTPTPEPTATDTPTPEPTATWTPTPEPTATDTPTPEPTATDTPTPEPTATWTPTVEPTATDTPTPEPTTPAPGPTATPTPAPIPTATGQPTVTPTPTVAWTPTPTPPPNCQELLINGDFESGDFAPWGHAGAVELGPGRESERAAWFGGANNAEGELWQAVSIPADAHSVILHFWWLAEAESEQPDDAMEVIIQHGQDQADHLRTLPAVDPRGVWQEVALDLSAYAGREIALTFLVHTDAEVPSTFRLDDVSLRRCAAATMTPMPTATSTPTATPSATAIITFEEGIPNPDVVRTQYCNNAKTNKGVEFLNGDRIIAPGVQVSSPTHALTTHHPGQEFDSAKTLRIRFTTGQSYVGVKVGLDRGYKYPMVATMIAYSNPTPGSGFITYQTAYLGNGPTAVTKDLSVQSAAGNIRSVEIEFAAATPNYWGYEVIDDLTFSAIGPPCITDTTPPTVLITQPLGDGLTFQSPDMLFGFVAYDADSGVARVRITYLDQRNHTLAAYDYCGANAAPACVYDVYPHTISNQWTIHLPPHTARIRVEAWDFTGQKGQAERTLRLIDIGEFNLWAQALEITQGTQPWLPVNTQAAMSGSTPPTFTYPPVPTAVPLVAHRKTVVRFYADVAGTKNNQNLENVRAQLRCYRDAAYSLPCPPPYTLNPLTIPHRTAAQITLHPGENLDAKRRDIGKSWLFVLPNAWTAAGKIYLEAEVLPPQGLHECWHCVDAANRIRVAAIPFQNVPNFSSMVYMVRVRRRVGTHTYEPTLQEMNRHVAYLRPRYPVAESTLPNGFNTTWTYTDDVHRQIGVRCDDLYHQLVKAFPNRANRLAVYAVVDSGFGCSGRGGGGYAYGNTPRVDSFPHEVGHAVGLKHAGPPPGHGAECNFASWCDTDWPWPHGTLGAYGFDVFAYNVIVPGTTENDAHDFMSYGGPIKWVSPRNWIRIFAAFTHQNLPYPKSGTSFVASQGLMASQGQGPTPHLLLNAMRGEDGTWAFAPIYEIDLPEGEGDTEGEGAYRLILLGAGGEPLFEHRFDVPLEHVDMPDNSRMEAPLSFNRSLPLPDGVVAVELRQGETLLARRERSPHAPTVTLLAPTQAGFGTPSEEPVQIRWHSEDADRDELTAMVQYRPSPEAPWRTLAVDWPGEELEVDPATLPGGDAAQVRVLVSDGFNTAQALSQPFSLVNKPPQAQIQASATTIQEGDLLTLTGVASDLEDETLPNEAFSWILDGEEVLGTGPRLDVTNLTAGEHVIRLEVRDSQDETATAEVTITVNERPNTQPIANAGPDQTSAHGCRVWLDGRGSRDEDGDPLTYVWSIVAQPAGSQAWLSDAEAPATYFFADRAGDYEIELNVHDGRVAALPDRVTVHVTSAGALKSCLYVPMMILKRY